MAFATELDQTLRAGIDTFLLVTPVTKSDTVLVMTLALTSDAVVVPWLDMASGMSTGKRLRLRTVMAFAPMPDMTPIMVLDPVTVTVLDKTADTTNHLYPWLAADTAATTGVKPPPEPT